MPSAGNVMFSSVAIAPDDSAAGRRQDVPGLIQELDAGPVELWGDRGRRTPAPGVDEDGDGVAAPAEELPLVEFAGDTDRPRRGRPEGDRPAVRDLDDRSVDDRAIDLRRPRIQVQPVEVQRRPRGHDQRRGIDRLGAGPAGIDRLVDQLHARIIGQRQGIVDEVVAEPRRDVAEVASHHLQELRCGRGSCAVQANRPQRVVEAGILRVAEEVTADRRGGRCPSGLQSR